MFGPFCLIENCIYICNTMLCKLHVSICKDHHIFAQQIQKGNETGCQAYRQTDRPSHCANVFAFSLFRRLKYTTRSVFKLEWLESL